MPRRQDNPYAPHDWAPHENRLCSARRRRRCTVRRNIAYGVVGLLVCLTGALGNAVVTANLQLLGYLRRLVDRNRLAARRST
jgi:hypothetical protein